METTKTTTKSKIVFVNIIYSSSPPAFVTKEDRVSLFGLYAYMTQTCLWSSPTFFLSAVMFRGSLNMPKIRDRIMYIIVDNRTLD